nr:NADH-quinone oxidoreductase subunit L [Candidatus Liberibacter sp.]
MSSFMIYLLGAMGKALEFYLHSLPLPLYNAKKKKKKKKKTKTKKVIFSLILTSVQIPSSYTFSCTDYCPLIL